MAGSLLFIIQKIITGIITVFVIITITFFLMRGIPGNIYNDDKVLSEAAIRNIQVKYHLNEPLFVQYVSQIKNIAFLDFGNSMISEGRSVNNIILTHLPTSALIGILSFMFSFSIGISAGVFIAASKSNFSSKILPILIVLGMTLPNFVIAALLQYLFSVKISVFPVLSGSSWIGFVLPVIALSIYPIAFIARSISYGMIDILQKDYIVAAKARGIPYKRIIFIHGLKNAILPLFSYLGPFLATILVGSFAIETIFNIPGLGAYYIDSISNRDYTTIMGLTIFFAVLLIGINIIVDLINVAVDPRIREKL